MPPAPSPRTALVENLTNETTVQVALALDGGPLEVLPHHSSLDGAGIPSQTTPHHASQDTPRQQIWVWTGIGFLDHLLHALAKHAGWSLRIRVRGDLTIDDHHTAEDTFLALGDAFAHCWSGARGLARFGHAYAPLDEALARAVVDLSGRPFFVGVLPFRAERIGALNTQMVHHCLQSFAQRARITLHVDVLRGDNDHHCAEAAFKALAVACRQATTQLREREGEVASTKGIL